jgi:dienelactone hydrolase
LDFSKPIVAPVGEEVLVESDVPFDRSADELKLDVYRPASSDDDDAPGVLMVYGDTDPEELRHARQWGQYRSWGTVLANHGFVAVVPDHRSHRTVGLKAASEDVAAGLEFVGEHGSRFGIDTSRLAVFGISFGVAYQLWAIRHSSVPIRALVCYYGFMDLRGFEDALDEPTEAVAEFAAIDHFNSGEKYPPMLVVRAGKDFEGLNATIDSFNDAASLHGQELELLRLDDASHAFDVVDDAEASRGAIARTLEFFRAHLR